MRRRAWLFAVVGLLAGAAAPQPAGYRMDHYNAPVPAALDGAQVLTTQQAQAWWRSQIAVFIDVLPQPPRPAGLPAGTLWQPKPRRDIPGSVWLPDVGYGALPAPMQAYFVENLRAASGGLPDRPLVFYCRAACWHSWNAAKRSLALGYRKVAWYPGGTEGWLAAGLPVEARTPVPRPNLSE